MYLASRDTRERTGVSEGKGGGSIGGVVSSIAFIPKQARGGKRTAALFVLEKEGKQFFAWSGKKKGKRKRKRGAFSLSRVILGENRNAARN